MKIGGHPLRQHLRILSPLFVLLAGVWVLRWIIGCINTPGWLLQVVSLTFFAPVAVLLAVLMLHVRRFGGYASVVACSLLLNAWTETLIVLAIMFRSLRAFRHLHGTDVFSRRCGPASPVPHPQALTYGSTRFAGAAMDRCCFSFCSWHLWAHQPRQPVLQRAVTGASRCLAAHGEARRLP
jgi:hypothetical protein